MTAKAHIQKYWNEDPAAKGFKRSDVGWGEHLVGPRSPGSPPPLPSHAPHDARMVWNPELSKYVVGLKRYNYVPDLAIWLGRNRELKARQRSSRSPRRSPSRSPRRLTRRVTRYYNEKSKTYKPASRSPSTRRKHRH